MERRVNKKVVDYICGFKDNIVSEIQTILSDNATDNSSKEQYLNLHSFKKKI